MTAYIVFCRPIKMARMQLLWLALPRWVSSGDPSKYIMAHIMALALVMELVLAHLVHRC